MQVEGLNDRMVDVDSNLNYMLGQLSLVVQEFNQVTRNKLSGKLPRTDGRKCTHLIKSCFADFKVLERRNSLKRLNFLLPRSCRNTAGLN